MCLLIFIALSSSEMKKCLNSLKLNTVRFSLTLSISLFRVTNDYLLSETVQSDPSSFYVGMFLLLLKEFIFFILFAITENNTAITAAGVVPFGCRELLSVYHQQRTMYFNVVL